MTWATGLILTFLLPLILIGLAVNAWPRKRDDIVAERRRRIERDGYFVRSGYTRMVDRRWPR